LEASLPRQPLHLRLLLAAILAVGVLSTAACATPATTTSARPQAQPIPNATASPTPAPETPAPAPAPSAPTPAAEPVSGLKTATVVRVVDGDTAVFAIGGRQEKTRFIGINTPESTIEHEPYGEEASKYTKRVLEPGRKVYLEYDAELRDRYGRLLAYIWLERPTAASDAELRAKQFNARLLLHGYAQQMTIQPNSKYADFYTVYAREAREANRGLWALPLSGGTSRAPAAGSQSASPAGGYVGSRRSNKFHTRECQWGKQIASYNLVVFKTRAAAIKAGYVPCKVCKP
jgi:micrococcal nuclease